MNALLGEHVLPTSHNAATSVLCEIKHSEHSALKYAIVHYDNKGSKDKLDLTKQDNLAKLESLINSARNDIGLLGSFTNIQRQKCVKIEIYWPLEFLKVQIVQEWHFIHTAYTVYIGLGFYPG